MSECSSRIREGSINFGLYTLRSNSWLSPSKMLSFLLAFDPFNIKISFVSFQSTWRNESRFHLTEGCWRNFWCRHTFILILFLWTIPSADKQKHSFHWIIQKRFQFLYLQFLWLTLSFQFWIISLKVAFIIALSSQTFFKNF